MHEGTEVVLLDFPTRWALTRVLCVFWHWRSFWRGSYLCTWPSLQPSRGGAFFLSHTASCQGKEHPLYKHYPDVVHIFSKPVVLAPVEGFLCCPTTLTMVIISMRYSQHMPLLWLLSSSNIFPILHKLFFSTTVGRWCLLICRRRLIWNDLPWFLQAEVRRTIQGNFPHWCISHLCN